MNEGPIRNVSDTARWVASYRALESNRPDALFSDPLAARLAGDRGNAMANLGPKHMRTGWFIVMRTKLIDERIYAAVATGADLILNLAAGLDTRPYRMDLPPALRWVEADLPGILEEKNAALADQRPRCQLTRIAVDLSDPASRRAFIKDAAAGARNVLVITEGLLIYLEEATVLALAKDLTATPEIRTWLMELNSPKIIEMMHRRLGKELALAPMKFAPTDGVAYFEALGWRATSVRSLFREAIRHRRLPLWMRIVGRLARDPNPRRPKGPWSAVVNFERVESSMAATGD